MHDDTWSFDPATDTWTRFDIQGAKPSARAYYAACFDGSRDGIWLHGGFDGKTMLDDLWFFDCAKDAWSKVDQQGELPPLRDLHSMIYNANRDQLMMPRMSLDECAPGDLAIATLPAATETGLEGAPGRQRALTTLVSETLSGQPRCPLPKNDNGSKGISSASSPSHPPVGCEGAANRCSPAPPWGEAIAGNPRRGENASSREAVGGEMVDP